MTVELPQYIMQSRIKLMLSQPYLASAIARFPVVNAADQDWCDTLATDGYYIYVNPDFCKSFSSDQIAFLFAHEVMHCVLGHIDRKDRRDAAIWNMAIDFATNLLLVEFGLSMPDEGLYDHRYRGMTSEDIYDALISGKTSPSPTGVSGDGEEDSGNSDGESGDSHGSLSRAAGGIDHHLAPEDLRGRSIRAQEYPTLEERKRIRIALTKEMKSKLRGTAAGLMNSEIKKATISEIPWRVLLSRFFTGLRKDDYRLMPPNKKHIHRGLYLPSMGVPGPDHLIIAVDTSGSMNDEVLARVLGEIDNLRSVTQCSLTLIQCDAKIQDVKQYDEYTAVSFGRYRFYGRGGTSFIPVFEWIKENVFKQFSGVDALIYLTDGFGSFPDKRPPYPVLWIMTEHSQPEVPFGDVIRMQLQQVAA